MKLWNPFRELSFFERGLWGASVAVIVVSFMAAGGGDGLMMLTSVLGATALIFVAKGYVLGQVLTVAFAVLYGMISYHFRYYGEMITYLGMTAPSAIAAAVAWLRHPYQGTREVKVNRLTKKQAALLALAAAVTTAAFYFILSALGNASLWVSTLSITTSFVASGLTFLRSPYYAVAYAANDIVLVVLWILAAAGDIACLPMVMCFVMFLLNDLYGFFNWQRMRAKQV